MTYVHPNPASLRLTSTWELIDDERYYVAFDEHGDAWHVLLDDDHPFATVCMIGPELLEP